MSKRLAATALRPCERKAYGEAIEALDEAGKTGSAKAPKTGKAARAVLLCRMAI